jgi:hypothetical protein
LWIFIALSVTFPAQVVTQIGSVGIEFIGGYLMGRAYIRTPQEFIRLCKVLVFLVLCSAPFALYETLTGRPIIVEMIRKIPGVTSVGMVAIEKRLGLERVQLTFAHPIHYGLFCSVVLSLCYVALNGVFSTTRRLLSSIVIILCGFLALSSGAFLAIVLQIFLISWTAIFARQPWRWWLLMGIFALGYVVIDLLSNRDPLSVFMSYATFSAHNAYWRSIIFTWGLKNIFGDVENNIPSAIWFGIGLNNWIRPWYMYSGSMDNFWLVNAVRYGVPGFLFLALGYAAAIFTIMRRNFDADLRLTYIRRAWVFTFLGLSFTLCTVHVWTNAYSFVFFMFGAGMWLIKQPVGEPPKDDTALPDQSVSASGRLTRRPRYSRFPSVAPQYRTEQQSPK